MARRPAHRLPFVTALAAAAAAACAEPPPAADPIREALTEADAVNPCVLLDPADIDSLLAAPAGAPEEESYEDASLCLWPHADDISVELVSVAIMDAIADNYDDYLRNSERLLGYTATPDQAILVDGPGRFAVWIPDGEAGVFQFFIENHMIQVAAGPARGRTALEICRALAEIIDRRLP